MTLTRKRVFSGAAVLGLCGVASVVLAIQARPSAGQLLHDETLQTTTLHKTWRIEHVRHDHCLVVGFRGKMSGNARPTWGLTGPVTVWENLRIHHSNIRVDATKLEPNGECTGRATMQKVAVAQQWKTGDGDWHGGRSSWVVSGRRVHTSTSEFATVQLDGGAYDRGADYEATLGLYIEPHWRIRHGSASDGVHVKDIVELPVD